MAQASSAVSTSDAKSVSSPSQSASSPTETNSSLTKSEQEQLLSESEDRDISKSVIEKNNPTFKGQKTGTKDKRHTVSPDNDIHKISLGSPETIDDDDLSGTGGIGFNPTRDNLTDGLVGLLRPSLEALDKGVCNTRDAQNELKDRINSLEQQLLAIEAEQSCPVDLETYINKINSSKKRILVVNTILQGAQDRLNKVHQNCLKETAKRRTLLENSPSSTQTPSESSNLRDTRQLTSVSTSSSNSITKSLAFQ